jgi:very-short-patch-repair endonuclease
MTQEWLELAQGQAGIITASQLAAAGVPRRYIRVLLGAGVIERVSRDRFFLRSRERDWLSRVWVEILEAGPGAFACRRTAAALWDLDGVGPGSEGPGHLEGPIDIAVTAGRHPRRPGTIRLASVAPSDLVLVSGVPATSAARTLVDLGSSAGADVVEQSVECALRRHLVSLDELVAVAGSTRSMGAGALRNVLSRRPAGAPPTESNAETLFVFIVRVAALPDPHRQFLLRYRGHSYRLDFAWPRLRLAVEIDGAVAHGPGRLTADLRRQNEIVLDGWLILRFSWAMVTFEARRVQQDLRTAWALRAIGA